MNYYEILEIDKNATSKEIKKHYYNLAKKYHPDKNSGNNLDCEKFKQLSEAYSTLSNPKKRYLYDLKIKLNIDDSFDLKFTEDDYELLHEYYNKLMNYTEIKFMKLLFNNLPEVIKNKVKTKLNKLFEEFNEFKTEKTNTLIHLNNIKYINITDLKEEYIVNLRCKFIDIYNNVLKQIIIIDDNNSYHLFITSYNYKIIINRPRKRLILNIVGDLTNFEVKNNDLIYIQNINLYQYYYSDYYTLNLNREIKFKNHYDKTEKIENMGLKDILNNKRGDLYIIYKLDLSKNKLTNDINDKLKINELFNIV